jgi:hypothetical protein
MGIVRSLTPSVQAFRRLECEVKFSLQSAPWTSIDCVKSSTGIKGSLLGLCRPC